MRKLSELIVLIKGGGETGSAIAHRLYQSHFRVCITEVSVPSAICRGVSFSEAVFDNKKVVEGVTGERILPTLEQIYRVWRSASIPVIVDLESSVKPLIKPDVLINAMMLKRETNSKITEAPVVIGIGPGFTAGENTHLVVESKPGHNLGKVIIEGESEPEGVPETTDERIIKAADSGVFTTEKDVGDAVAAGDIIGMLDDVPLTAAKTGVLRGILHSEMKVLANTNLAEIDPVNDKDSCFIISDRARAIAGGVLEAIMMSLNLPEVD